ncbi:hypothetical protein ACVW1C_007282 [Bradyrhizobium sp. USDA 4011]
MPQPANPAVADHLAALDVQAAIKHVPMTPNSYPLSGRMKLGLPLGTTWF